MDRDDEPLLIISSDGHVGPPVEAYRDYIDPRHRADYEDWLAQYQPLWMATRLKDAALPETLSESYKREWIANDKIAAGAEGTWNPAKRLELLDADGIAADVLFPDDQSGNSPPFLWFAREYHRRWDQEYSPALKLAGARAYNRWLADYCAAAPERLLGLAMVGSLADAGAAAAEVRRAHESGLTAGVLLPLVYYNIAEPFWNDPSLDPLWATCAELNMPVHTHTGSGGPYYGTGVDAPILYSVECTWYPHRPLWFMTMSGVFERHPGLRLVLTEQGSGWVLEWLAIMDAMATDRKFAFAANSPLTMKPSDYFRRQCWLGSSLVRRPEIELRHAIGVGKMMWGWDFPHIESEDWLTPQDNIRGVMQGVPEAEVRAMLAENAVDAYGLDLARLRPVADRVGPRVGELVSA